MAKLYWDLNVRNVSEVPPKRFWLFLNAEYEAEGGMDDFRGSFDTLQEAVEEVNKMNHSDDVEEGHIYDSLTHQIMGGVSRRPPATSNYMSRR